MKIDPFTGGHGLLSLPDAIRNHLLIHCGTERGRKIWEMVKPAIQNWKELAEMFED